MDDSDNIDIASLRFGMLHSKFALEDGVSIVMNQIEHVLTTKIGVPKSQICYLAGTCGSTNTNVTLHPPFDCDQNINALVTPRYESGFTAQESKVAQQEIDRGAQVIRDFVNNNDLNVLIAHNTCHPVNFVLSMSLSRYFEEEKAAGRPVPKYVLWWHDSHLERVSFSFPHEEFARYVAQGIPGPHIDHVVFINSVQPKLAIPYFLSLPHPQMLDMDDAKLKHSIIYNTSDTFIDEYKAIDRIDTVTLKEKFFSEYHVEHHLDKIGATPSRTLFLLQHTRMVDRKRIDFALEYAFTLLKELRKEGKKDALYFLVSGNDTNGEKKKLKALYEKLCQEHEESKLLLEFAEDRKATTTIAFEEYPLIFAHLRGLSTYFSKVEGFGNNLLEVLANGLIPVIYEYPIYQSDIAQFEFNLLSTKEFVCSPQIINSAVTLIDDEAKRASWVQENLAKLKEHLSHEMMAKKLARAIRN